MATQVTSINSSGTLYVAGGIDEAMIGTGSVFFNGTNQSLSIVNPVIATGTNDFTIEAWVYATTILPSTPTIASTTIGNSNAGFHWYFGAGGFGVRRYTANIVLPAGIGLGTALQPNTWYHCAYTRLGSVHSTWLNGALVNSASAAAEVFSDSTLTIGNSSVGQFFGGYISNLRLINGTAIYTSNFTVTRAPLNRLFNTTFLMNKIYGQSTSTNSIVDSSTYNSTVTNVNSAIPANVNPFYTGELGSFYFDGAKLTPLVVTSPSAFPTGFSDFTCEWWTNLTMGYGNFPRLIQGSGVGVFQVYITGNTLTIGGDGSFTYLTADLSSYANKWIHIAITRHAFWISLFINGIRITTSFNSTNPLLLGSGNVNIYYTEGGGPKGYLTNFRVVNSATVYATNTNFTPPTQPLTLGVYTTNTTVLLTTPFATSSTNINSSILNYTANNRGSTATVFSPFVNNLSNPPTLLNTVERISTQGLQTAGEIDEITLVSGSVNLSTAWVKALNSTSFRTQNLTMECWFYPTASAGNGMIIGGSSQSNGGFGDINIFQVSNALNLYVSAAGGAWAISAAVTGNIDNNRWHHLAMVRNGSTFNVYLNGTSTYVNSGFNYDFTRGSQPIFIGGNDYLGGPNNVFAGYISNARVVVGTAVYTSNFTPPAAPLTATTGTFWLLSTPYNNNYLRDFSTSTSVSLTAGTVTRSNLSPFSTVGSLFFNSSTQNLILSGGVGSPLDLSTGAPNWTIEGWFYGLGAAVNGTIFWKGGTSSAGTTTLNGSYSFEILNGATQFIVADASGPTNGIATGAGAPLPNRWYHFVFQRNSGWYSAFLNGVCGLGPYPASFTQRIDSNPLFSIGNSTAEGSNRPFNGYISNVRIVKGSAVYSTNTNFTPPTQPLTVMGTQTSLLLSTPFGTGAFIDSSLNNLSIGNVNATASSILNPFTNNLGNPPTTTSTVQRVNSNGLQVSGSFDEFSMNRGSVLLNGSTQLLTVPTNAGFTFGTGDFTVEGWYYFNSLTGSPANYEIGLALLGTGATAVNFSAWYLRYNANSYGNAVLGFYRYDGTETTNNFSLPSANYFVTNTWYHIACTRRGNNLRMFLNGSQVGATITSSLNFASINADALQIGKVITGNGTYFLNGYVSNFRIVKNVAVYTSNFTRPTTPFSSTDVYSTQTSILLNTVAYPPLNTVDNSLNNFTVTPTAAPLPSELNPFV